MDANLPASYDDDRMREPEWYNEEETELEPGDLDPEDYNLAWDTVGDVAAQFGCPLCGNRDCDTLLLPDWGDGDDVRCEVCGLWYKLEG